ncbi:MAG: bi-domain-containing oxidoreductase [bacterium]
MKILDVPCPVIGPSQILVRNYYSLISAGTESSTVYAARKGYIGKARGKPEQVKQVFDSLRSQGIVQTYRAVMKKLDAHSPLGYSTVGRVIDMGPDVIDFTIGDFVACGGAGIANHADLVAVPRNLAVRLPVQGMENGTSYDDYLQSAAYNTVGAIALQGIRQADMRLGEVGAVIGLGLLGQLTCQMLRTSGVQVIGIDINDRMVEIASHYGADIALNRDDPIVMERILQFTNGYGVDCVIITAASTSLDPVNFAGAITRKKGRVIIVGAVPTGFQREPDYYKKELELKMSCSYGPGRYDPVYEEKGVDYPVGYVRWTEKRNMEAFQRLIAQGKVRTEHLTTHVFDLENAPSAYDMIMEKSEAYIGILIKYDISKGLERGIVKNNALKAKATHAASGNDMVGIGFIGAGSYAQSFLLPNIKVGPRVRLKGVMTSTSTSSRSVMDRYGFEFCTGDAEDILASPEINTVFIATRNDTHGLYVKKALLAGKNVFVEKPLCLNCKELDEIKEIIYTGDSNPKIMVGFNRRFSPLIEKIKSLFGNSIMAIHYRINAGNIPMSSWIQDPCVGGGRIIGEVCHFVDLLTYLTGALPVSVYAASMNDSHNASDTLTVNLKYANGSIGAISYFANGNKALPKEYLEVFCNGAVAAVDDYKRLVIYGNGKKKTEKLRCQDKGQKNEVERFIETVMSGGKALIRREELLSTTLVCFEIVESIRNGKVAEL